MTTTKVRFLTLTDSTAFFSVFAGAWSRSTDSAIAFSGIDRRGGRAGESLEAIGGCTPFYFFLNDSNTADIPENYEIIDLIPAWAIRRRRMVCRRRDPTMLTRSTSPTTSPRALLADHPCRVGQFSECENRAMWYDFSTHELTGSSLLHLPS